MNFDAMAKQRKMILIAAALGLICMFLPWISLIGSVNGMHGWGIFVFFCFVIAGGVAYMGDQTKNLDQFYWMVVLIAAAIASLIMVINFINYIEILGILSFGFYGALAAAVAILALTYLNRSATDSIQGGLDNLKNRFNSSGNK